MEEVILEIDDLQELLNNSEEYSDTKNYLEEIILDDLDNKNETCLVNLNGNDYLMSAGNLWTSLILWKPFLDFDVEINEDYIIDPSEISNISKYLDMIIKDFTDIDINVRSSLLDVISELSYTSSKILEVYGATINLYDVCNLMKTNKTFKSLVDFSFKSLNKNLEFEEMNHILDEGLKTLLDILTTEDNCYKNLLLSKSGLSDRQLREVLYCIGPKPNGLGSIIAEPVDSSYIKGQSPFDFLVDAYGGRTALILNYRNTKDSGYLTRKLSLLCIDEVISEDVNKKMIDDCGTKQTIKVEIDSEKTLKKLYMRKYVEKGKIKTIDENSTNLIGKTINLRSPIKCACQKGICKTCYGDLWKYNHDMVVGLIAVLLLTNPYTQFNLSAKHNIQAVANKIVWGETFLKYFTVNKDQILINDSSQNFKIILDEIFEDEDNSYYLNEYNFNNFKIDTGKELLQIELPVTLVVNEEIDIESYYNAKEDEYVIPSKDFEETDILFNYTMENNGITAVLALIKKLIETNYFIKQHTIDETTNEFFRILNNSPIGISFVHIEVILKQLCAIKDNDRSLFKKKDSPITEVYRVTEALIKNPSVSKSIVYQEFYRQITQMIDTYDKNDSSIIDTLLV